MTVAYTVPVPGHWKTDIAGEGVQWILGQALDFSKLPTDAQFTVAFSAHASVASGSAAIDVRLGLVPQNMGSETSTLILSQGFTGPYSATITGSTAISRGGVPVGVQWTARTGAVRNDWRCACYGAGKFVVVAYFDGHSMVSVNGIDWTSHAVVHQENSWSAVCYGDGPGLFVAVGVAGTGNRVMTSPDGLNWTIQTSAANNSWTGVCYGAGIYVAVAYNGSGNQVMTSPDGVNWTAGAGIPSKGWRNVTYCEWLGLFVAVAYSGTSGQRVMTSPDGFNWTLRNTPSDNAWYGICAGDGILVATATTGTGNRVMTSTNAIDWTLQTSPADFAWETVKFGGGMFVAVASDAVADNPVMTSVDGIHWTLRAIPPNGRWRGLCYGNGTFLAAASYDNGSGTRLMTSAAVPPTASKPMFMIGGFSQSGGGALELSDVSVTVTLLEGT
jgi:hypothetical protein